MTLFVQFLPFVACFCFMYFDGRHQQTYTHTCTHVHIYKQIHTQTQVTLLSSCCQLAILIGLLLPSHW